MSMEELLGSPTTDEHTMQMDKEEMQNNKNLILKVLMQGEMDNLDEEMSLITLNCKRFLRKKVEIPTSRR